MQRLEIIQKVVKSLALVDPHQAVSVIHELLDRDAHVLKC